MPTKIIRDIDPFTEKVFATLPPTTPAETRQAVARARAAQPAWARLSLRKRLRCVEAINGRLEEAAPELAPLITRETGKPICEARGEIGAAQRRVRIVCGRAPKELGRGKRITADGYWGKVIREPLGVAAVMGRPMGVSIHVGAR